jgi:citronellyl-CoA dehydrogenase
MANALGRDVLGETLAYLAERSAFGRRLAEMQAWRHRMADLMTELEASELLTYRAADQLVARHPEAEVSVSMAKLFAAELARRLLLDCGQAFGGYGFMEESYVARATRGAYNWGVGAGTSEVMREIIAKRRMPAPSH